MKKTALFSLHILDRADEFANSLVKLGWEIIASRETYNVLSEKGLPVIDVAEFTGIKEDYGVPPTLHPKIETCLTMEEGNSIDLVYVIPYPLSVGRDIGGRTLLALAAKGNRIPVMSISDMELVVNELRTSEKLSKDLHKNLINKTNAMIANHYGTLVEEGDIYEFIFGNFKYNLKNGENPYQIPAQLFCTEGKDLLSITNFTQVSGELPCFTNLADSDCIVHTMCLVYEAFTLRYKKTPYICIVSKHGNPCGVGTSWDDPALAIDNALFGNPRAIWGGEVIVNFAIDKIYASMLFKSRKREEFLGDSAWMLDIILAPGFTKEAVNILGQRKNRKLFENKALLSPSLPPFKYSYRLVRGGFLRQPPNNFVLDFTKTELIGSELDDNTIELLIIAWAVAWSSNHGGNEIAIVKDSQLIGAGGGPSTIEAALTALTRAKDCGHDLAGAVFAANAFFPFTDAPQILAENHLKVGLVPMGGKLFDVVQRLFLEKGLSMVYITEQYRGFCRH